MEAMNLLVVERGADWSHWAAASQLLGQAAVVLVQQGDESGAAFRARIASRLQRIKTTAIDAVVLLRGRRKSGRSSAGIGTARFLRELVAGARQGLRIFPSSSRRSRRARSAVTVTVVSSEPATAAVAAPSIVTPVPTIV